MTKSTDLNPVVQKYFVAKSSNLHTLNDAPYWGCEKCGMGCGKGRYSLLVS